MIAKKAVTQVPINETLSMRWSGCAFDIGRPIANNQILALAEAARWAPSSYGDEPWRFIFCTRDSNYSAWNKLLGCMVPSNRTWAANAPLLILTNADSRLRKGKPNRWGQYDTGMASMSLCLQATALGLISHQAGGFDIDTARTCFSIPDQFTPMSIICIGYQLPEDNIPDDMREREYSKRNRLPISENFYLAKWGQGLDMENAG